MELRSKSHSLVLRLDVVSLLSNTAWQYATSIVSFTCVGTDYAGSPEDWRQVEDLFDRILCWSAVFYLLYSIYTGIDD